MGEQNLTSNRNWGGKRKGAGRPAMPAEKAKKNRTYRVSNEEDIAIKELLKKMRNTQ